MQSSTPPSSAPARARDTRGSHRVYVAATLGLAALVFGSIAAFNIAIDPFRAFRLSYSESRFREASLGTRRVSKGELLRHAQARVILLGSSRVERGLDPSNPAWGSADTYNLGLGATNLWEVLRVFRYAVRHEPLEHVVLSLDMLMFNSNRQFEWDFRQSLFNEQRRYPEYRLGTVLSRYAIESSRRVLERLEENVTDANDDRGFLPKGVGPGFDYRGASMKLLRNFMVNPKSYGPYTDDGTRWTMLREIIDTCRARGIRLTIILPPSHALDMEMLWVSGNWDAFETWKRRLAEIVSASNAAHLDLPPIPLWDFTTHAGRNAEPLPGPLDPATRLPRFGSPVMQDWIETSHFTKAYGDAIAARVMGVHHDGPPASGVLLTPDNIDDHLARLRADRDWFVNAFPADAQTLANMWRNVSRVRESSAEAGG